MLPNICAEITITSSKFWARKLRQSNRLWKAVSICQEMKHICSQQNCSFENWDWLTRSKFNGLLGLIHTRHFGTQYCDKKIKRHFWSNIFFHCVNWKYLFLSMDTRVCIENHNILKCHYNILKKKLSFYQNIFLSQYLFIAILCVKMSRVNKA